MAKQERRKLPHDKIYAAFVDGTDRAKIASKFGFLSTKAKDKDPSKPLRAYLSVATTKGHRHEDGAVYLLEKKANGDYKAVKATHQPTAKTAKVKAAKTPKVKAAKVTKTPKVKAAKAPKTNQPSIPETYAIAASPTGETVEIFAPGERILMTLGEFQALSEKAIADAHQAILSAHAAEQPAESTAA